MVKSRPVKVVTLYQLTRRRGASNGLWAASHTRCPPHLSWCPTSTPYNILALLRYSSGLMEITWLELSGCMLTP